MRKWGSSVELDRRTRDMVVIRNLIARALERRKEQAQVGLRAGTTREKDDQGAEVRLLLLECGCEIEEGRSELELL